VKAAGDAGDRAGNGETDRARFAAALLDPDRPLPAGIVDRDGRPAPKRFAVYRNNVTVALVEALAAAYPSVHAILGRENFRRVSRNFIAATPPRSPFLLGYGAGFAIFLESFPPLRASPFLGDVARVERAWLESWHGVDAPTLDPRALVGVAAQDTVRLVFEPHPASALIASRWPVGDLFQWRFGRPAQGVDLSLGQCVMVSRLEHEVAVNPISAGERRLLQGLSQGRNLGEAADAAFACEPGLDLAAALGRALAAGFFTAARLDAEALR
jgi:hypothetical protein